MHANARIGEGIKNIKILAVFGTRPEAVKMCPLVLALHKNEAVEIKVCLTGQHKEMLEQVIDIFQIKIEDRLDIMRPKQSLERITADVLEGMAPIFSRQKPDLVLVHGDTTTSFAVALAAFYHQIPVGHVEAGLRTFQKYSPFPEEMNRVMTARIAELHFAPTPLNKENLEKEGVTKNIYVTGNTVIDAFATTIRKEYRYKNSSLKGITMAGKRIVLLTAHRRENWGKPLENICHAVKRLAAECEDMVVIYPVHLNPIVHHVVHEMLGGISNIYLIDPIDVEDMHNLLSACFLVLTDSGGLQEEAPSLGVPVLVMRTETERPEAVMAGTARMVGVEEEEIYGNVMQMFMNEKEYMSMQCITNPYGDGKASQRIISAILNWWESLD